MLSQIYPSSLARVNMVLCHKIQIRVATIKLNDRDNIVEARGMFKMFYGLSRKESVMQLLM